MNHHCEKNRLFTKRRLAALLLCVCCTLGLAACSAAPEPLPPRNPEPIETPAPSMSRPTMPTEGNSAPDREETPPPPENSPEPPAELTMPMTDEEIIRRYGETIAALEPSVTLNVAGRTWTYGPENDLKNLYYTVLAQNQGLKYAYDMTAELSGDTALCVFSYMPYKTGAYAAGVPAGSHTVGSLHDADAMAQSLINGAERLSIAITDPSLEVEELQRAVGQGGYGWIVCTLSRDGTEIIASAPVNMTLQDCVENIHESVRLAGEILDEILTEDMTDTEKARAAYAYITENVAYDFRYYSNKSELPFVSTVALGALRDRLAICGGYSHAFELLLDMCGIENYTVSGISNGEYHAWNYVVLDGQGYYCDPTADRGGMDRHFLLTEDALEALGGYEWDAAFYKSLCRAGN